jgi:hypothetical protein
MVGIAASGQSGIISRASVLILDDSLRIRVKGDPVVRAGPAAQRTVATVVIVEHLFTVPEAVESKDYRSRIGGNAEHGTTQHKLTC